MRPVRSNRRHASLLLTLCLLTVLATGCAKAESPEAFYAENREMLANAVQKIMETGAFDEIELQRVERISCWEAEQTVVAFTLSVSGLVPESTYRGIYYSAAGVPVAFQGANVPLTETETGWAWAVEGDNCGTTAHIEGNWFTFEAAF